MKFSKKVLSLGLATAMVAGSAVSFALPNNAVVLDTNKAYDLDIFFGDLPQDVVDAIAAADGIWFDVEGAGFVDAFSGTAITQAEKDALTNISYLNADGTTDTYAAFDSETPIEEELTVESVSAVTEAGVTTVTADVLNAEEGATATVEIFANGDTAAAAAATNADVEIVDGKISTTFEGLPAGTHVARVTVGEVSADAEFTVEEVALAVESVSAINSAQIKVTFNKAVDETAGAVAANYVVKTNAGVAVAVGEVALNDSKTEATLTLGAAAPVGMTANKDYTLTIAKDLSDVNAPELATALTKTFATGEDINVPTVASVQAIGTSTIRVTFTEPVLLNGTDENTFAVKQANTAYVVGQDYAGTALAAAYVADSGYTQVDLNTTTAMIAGDYTLKVFGGAADVRDASGLNMVTTTKNFAVSEASTVATLSDITVNSRTEIVATFSAPVNTPAAGTATWDFGSDINNAATGITKIADNKLKYTFPATAAGALPVGDVTIEIAGVTDVYGNAVPTKSFVKTVSESAATTITAAQNGTAQTSVKVTFSNAMLDDNTTGDVDKTLTNYVITKPDGTTVNPTALAVDGTKKIVTMTVASLPAGNYSVAVSGVKTALGADVAGTASFTIADQTAGTFAPGIVTAYELNAASTEVVLIVKYPEAMDTTTARSILDKKNYSIEDFTAGASVELGASDKVEALPSVENAVKITLANFDWDNGKDTLKIKAVNDVYGNLYETFTEAAITPSVAYSIAGNTARIVGEKTLEVTTTRALSAIDRADFALSGGQNIESISYVNNATMTGATITVIADAPILATQKLGTIAAPTVTKDFAGVLINQGAVSSAAAIDGVAPVMTKAAVTAGNKVTLTFDKNMVAVIPSDFVVTVDGTTNLVNTAVAATGAGKVWTLTLKDSDASRVPTVKTIASPISIMANNVKLAANTTGVSAANVKAGSVAIVSEGTADLTVNDKIVVTFAQALDRAPIIAALADDLNATGEDTVAVAAGEIAFNANGGAGTADTIVIDGLGTFSIMDVTGDAVTADSLDDATATLTISADNKTITITFDNLGAGTAADVTNAKMVTTTFIPDATLTDADGNLINVDVQPVTADKF